MADKQKELLSLLVEAEAKHIVSENYENAEPEQLERIKNTIKMLADIIDKGGEIHPSISAAESISNLFPAPNQIMSIASKIKELKTG